MNLTPDDLDTHVKRCIRCGYDLRGQDEASGRCPECGLKAYWSLRAPKKLSQYPVVWIARMAAATWFLVCVYGGMFAVLLAAAAGLQPDIEEEVAIPALVVAAALQVAGTWMLSSWSRHWSEPRAPINRWTLRIAPMALLFASGCFAYMYLFHRYNPSIMRIAIGALVVGSATPVAIFLRLRIVARLIADAGLAEHSAIVGWGFFLTASLITIVGAAESFGWIPRDLGDAGLLLMLVIATSVLLFLLWGAFIFLSCAINFGRAKKVASAEWNEDAPQT